MRAIAMILAGGAGSRLSVLTQKRTKPAVPFAGKYRIIDFALSNCANSGLFTIGVCTQYRPRSLNAHVRIGRPWDLDRATGGLTILQPYVGSRSVDCADWYQGTADAIYQNLDFIQHYNPELVLILAGDHVYKMDYGKLFSFHQEREAQLTIGAIQVAPEEASRFGILESDGSGRVLRFEEKPDHPRGDRASMGIYVFNADVLYDVLRADAEEEGSRHDFGGDIIPPMIKECAVYAFPYDDYWVDVGTIEAYWHAQMDLLREDPPLDLRDRDWVIHTRSAERPPVHIAQGGRVSRSLLSDGCFVQGRVEHSLLSPGVIVREGAVVRDSVIMTDAIVESGAIVDTAILDKQVHVGEGALVGCGDESEPNVSLHLREGLTAVGKNTQIPAQLCIGRNCVVSADLMERAFSGGRIRSGSMVGSGREQIP